MLSMFCNFQRSVIRPFIHSTFCNSTFCNLTFCNSTCCCNSTFCNSTFCSTIAEFGYALWAIVQNFWSTWASAHNFVMRYGPQRKMIDHNTDPAPTGTKRSRIRRTGWNTTTLSMWQAGQLDKEQEGDQKRDNSRSAKGAQDGMSMTARQNYSSIHLQN